MDAPLAIGNTAARRPDTARAYLYRHRICFEDTNVVGNVYFARHVAWQGRCREMFLLDHAPGVVRALSGDLRLVTLAVACDYFAELHALDEVEIAMSLAHQRQHRIGLRFAYRLAASPLGGGAAGTLVASGTQEIGCMRLTAAGLSPCPVPEELARALDPYR